MNNGIIIILILVFVNNYSSEQPLSSCLKHKPFKTDDHNCANFSEICIKSDNKQCSTLLSACQQCPPNNLTTSLLIDLVQLVNSILKDKENNWKEISKLLNYNLTNQKLTALENRTSTISTINIIIIVLLILLIIIIVAEIRIKLFIKLQEKCFGRGRKKKYSSVRSVRNSVEKRNHSISQPIEDDDGAFHRILNLLNLKINPKLDEIRSSLKHFAVNSVGETITDDTFHKLIKFQLPGTTKSVELFVHSEDNVIKIKKQICEKWINAEISDYKKMILKDKDKSLNENDNLLDEINTQNIPINCVLDSNININDVIVVKVAGNLKSLPEMIQMLKFQTVYNIKEIICKNKSTNDFAILTNTKELQDSDTLEECQLKDFDWINIILKEDGRHTIYSVFDENDSVDVDYVNTDCVATLKNKICKEKGFIFDNLALFIDDKYCRKENFLFDTNIKQACQVQFCYLHDIDIVKINDKIIAEGEFSHLFEAIVKNTQRSIVIKRYDFNKQRAFLLNLKFFRLTKISTRFVKFLCIYKDKEEKFFYVAMEKMENGSLKDLEKPLLETKIRKLVQQVLQGLKNLHDSNEFYRDLRPSNILINKSDDYKLETVGLTIYLLGYGVQGPKGLIKPTKVGIHRYMAPELLNGENHSVKTDVWAFGATLVEIVTGKPPYSDKNEIDAVEEIKSSKKIVYQPQTILSIKLKLFIESCLQSDPKDRPTIEELLKNDFLK